VADVVILIGAQSDIFDAYLYYDSLDDGLGELFARQVDHALERVSDFPEIGASFMGRIRRLLVPRFPFGLFYTIEGDRIIVQAVLDLRQSPDQILRRLNHR
jgi:plasmid stabilization system protein ParE